ncbi:MAG: hypothetical protein EHM89_05595 [Acidobacteria bacterium]|nr:MAG: hypothetical protein EHM89_05595 [Acidobacteriota bacterium]
MIRTGLDFAPGTTDASKKLIGSLFEPKQLLSAYRAARAQFHTGDLVLTVSEQNLSGFEATPRTAYIASAKAINGAKPMPLFLRGLEAKSAQAVMELPFESDAMWLIVVRGTQDVPVMCVIYGIPYEVSDEDAN